MVLPFRRASDELFFFLPPPSTRPIPPPQTPSPCPTLTEEGLECSSTTYPWRALWRGKTVVGFARPQRGGAPTGPQGPSREGGGGGGASHSHAVQKKRSSLALTGSDSRWRRGSPPPPPQRPCVCPAFLYMLVQKQ
eukprot:gene13507-biopygen499